MRDREALGCGNSQLHTILGRRVRLPGREYDGQTTTFREFEATIIDWSWFFHKKTGKIPFLIRKDILASNEAVVTVIDHEMFELEMLRSIFAEGASIEKWEAETSPNNRGNFHWQAWDYADALVTRMREEEA